MQDKPKLDKYISVALSPSRTFVIHRTVITQARSELSLSKRIIIEIFWLSSRNFLGFFEIFVNLVFLTLFLFIFYASQTLLNDNAETIWFAFFALWTLLQFNDAAGDPLSKSIVRIDDGKLVLKSRVLKVFQKKVIEQALGGGKSHRPLGMWVYAFNKVAVMAYAVYASDQWGHSFDWWLFQSSVLGLALIVVDGLLLGLIDALGFTIPVADSRQSALLLYVVKALLGFGIIASAWEEINRSFIEREIYTGTEYNLHRYIGPYIKSDPDGYEILDCGPDPEAALDSGLTLKPYDKIRESIRQERKRVESELGIQSTST